MPRDPWRPLLHANPKRETPADRYRWQNRSEIVHSTFDPYMPTVQKEIDGETVEIDISADDLPDNYVLAEKDEVVDRSYHEQALEDKVDRVRERFDSSMREDVREELKQDEDFRKEVAAEVGMDEEERKQIVQEVEENKVKPAKEEAEGWRYRFKREKALSELEGREDVDPKALASIGNAEPLAMQALSDRLEIQGDDPTEAKVVMTDGDGNPLPSDDGGYASVSEGIERLKDDDEYQALFQEDQPSQGSGFNGSGTPSSSADDWDKMSQSEKIDFLKENDGNHPKKTA